MLQRFFFVVRFMVPILDNPLHVIEHKCFYITKFIINQTLIYIHNTLLTYKSFSCRSFELYNSNLSFYC